MNASLRVRGKRRISGSQVAAAITSAGTAGSTYTPRLPELSEKNSTTSTTHASSTATNVSREPGRRAARHRGHSQGTSAVSGSHRTGMTLTR